jgi:NAD-dependent deacetylase
LGEVLDVAVITQNIDDLHERSGSKNVIHLHGNIRLSKSSGPNAEKKYYPISGASLTENDLCPEGYRLRPHVVWFGEQVPNLDIANELIKEADYLIITGTSLNVYPAAGLIHVAKENAIKYLVDPSSDIRKPSIKNLSILKEKATNGIPKVANLIKKELNVNA